MRLATLNRKVRKAVAAKIAERERVRQVKVAIIDEDFHGPFPPGTFVVRLARRHPLQ